MGPSQAAAGAQQRLGLLLGVLAVALSLLAMHQLSSNHTAVDPTADPTAPVVGITADLSSAALQQHTDHQIGAVNAHHTQLADHTHLSVLQGDGQHPASESGECPGCGGHSAMALTCLAALVLLAVGWLLRLPKVRRGLRLRRHLPKGPAIRPVRLPRPPNLVELSISRT